MKQIIPTVLLVFFIGCRTQTPVAVITPDSFLPYFGESFVEVLPEEDAVRFVTPHRFCWFTSEGTYVTNFTVRPGDAFYCFIGSGYVQGG